MSIEPPRSQIGLASLVKLRFGAAAAELVVLFLAPRVLLGPRLDLPLGPVAAILGLTLATNLVLARGLASTWTRATWLPGAVLAYDTAALTALLSVSGGATNPFSVLYLVHVTLAAVMLGTRWSTGITVLSAVGYGLLFFASGDAHRGHGAAGEDFTAHLRGMWVAFTVAAALIAYFVSRLAEALRRREEELGRLRELAAKNQRLASLTTLAAGAAHELSTPLSTVAVVAKEILLKAAALEGAPGSELREDAALIRSEIERCRGILEQMSAESGESLGELPEPVPVEQVLTALRATLRRGEDARLRVERRGESTLDAPPRALVRVLSNAVLNAFDASGPSAAVVLEVECGRARTVFTVRDFGSGMAPEVLERAVEPFFTTKPEGKGLGLGLFLVQQFADRLGGRLTIESVVAQGTVVTLELPGLASTPT